LREKKKHVACPAGCTTTQLTRDARLMERGDIDRNNTTSTRKL